MISIILATYNGEKYLKEQLRSIANQTMKPNELIIVDDCSSDGTINIIENFRNINTNIDIKLFKNSKNIGPAGSFAKGVLESTGDLMFFCDQDDIWFNTKIEEVVSIFNNDSRVKILCSGYDIYDDSNKKIIEFSKNTKEIYNVPIEKVLEGNISPGCTMAVRSNYREKGILINKEIFIHDWFFTVLAALDNGLYYYDKPLIYYRIHNNNTIGKNLSILPKYSKSQREKSIVKHIRFYSKIKRLLIKKELNGSPKIINLLNNLIIKNKIRLDFLNGNLGYLSYFKKVINTKPINVKSIVGDILYAHRK